MQLRILKRIKEYTGTFLLLWHYKPRHHNTTSGSKTLFLDIRKNYFTRYLYLFLKFFHEEGYVIHLPRRFKLINEINNDHYASLLFRENIVTLGRPLMNSKYFLINDQMISPDYFSEIAMQTPSEPFFVPMAQHPIMYHAGIWNSTVKSIKRKKSVFMAGNFDPHSYETIDKDQLFNVMSRNTVMSCLVQRKLLYPINNNLELALFLKLDDDHKVILINRLIFDIPIKELRQLISGFDFYFALPGVVMPFAHNVIEAMSVGTIPFIQEEYSRLFKPLLSDGIEAIIFKNSFDLQARLEQALQSSDEEILRLRNNVLRYYHDNLTPQSVVQKIEKGNYKMIYLQAEHYSVELLKKRKS